MQKNNDCIAVYSRKSRFTGKGESIGNQVELCRAYIRTAFGDGYADSALVFEDEGFSGGNLNRPDFRRMMEAARKHLFRAIVVYRLDRVSRSIGDFAALIEELGRLEIDFVSIRESFDTSNPMGRAMMYIASVFSQLERETIAERIRDNMHELAKTGRWLGGTTPTGYAVEAVRTITADGRNRRSCRLKLIPQEADTVRAIYRIYTETDSLTRTETELLRRQIKTKNGRDFTRFAIKGILQNPVYLIADRDAFCYFRDRQAVLSVGPEAFDGVRGVLAYNRTDQEKGRAAVSLPVCDWIVAVGEHPGLIPSRTWIRVQESLERNRCRGYRKPRRNHALLTGTLWCGCGSRMYPRLSGRNAADGTPAYTYVCRRKEHSRGALCQRNNVNGNRLDKAIFSRLRHLPENTAAFRERLEQGRREAERTVSTADGKDRLLRRQADLRRRISLLVDALADSPDGTLSIPIRRRIEELQTLDAELDTRLCKAQADAARQKKQPEEGLCRDLALFGPCLDRMSPEEKRAVVHILVRGVVWDGNCARVLLWGAEDPSGPELPALPAPCGESESHRREDSK